MISIKTRYSLGKLQILRCYQNLILNTQLFGIHFDEYSELWIANNYISLKQIHISTQMTYWSIKFYPNIYFLKLNPLLVFK